METTFWLSLENVHTLISGFYSYQPFDALNYIWLFISHGYDTYIERIEHIYLCTYSGWYLCAKLITCFLHLCQIFFIIHADIQSQLYLSWHCGAIHWRALFDDKADVYVLSLVKKLCNSYFNYVIFHLSFNAWYDLNKNTISFRLLGIGKDVFM